MWAPLSKRHKSDYRRQQKPQRDDVAFSSRSQNTSPGRWILQKEEDEEEEEDRYTSLWGSRKFATDIVIRAD